MEWEQLRVPECENPAPRAQPGPTASTLGRRDTRDISMPEVQCDLCTQLFPSKSRLRAHMTRTHFSQHRHQCGICPFSSRTAGPVRRHWRALHPGAPMVGSLEFPCQMCGRRRTTERALANHVARRHGALLACPLCAGDGSFQSTEGLRAHSLATHGRCSWYVHQFTRYSETHLVVSQVGADQDTGLLSCYICSKARIPSRRLLFKHIVHTHYKILPFECGHCQVQSLHQQSMRNHYLRYHPEIDHKNKMRNLIGVFDKRLKLLTQDNYDNKNVGENEIVNLVDFGTLGSEMGSRGEPEVVCACEMCAELARDAHQLHIRAVHDSRKHGFECVMCGHWDYRLTQVRQHVTARHVVYARCRSCGTLTRSALDMQSHVRESHPGGCLACGECFSCEVQLRRHLVRSHGLTRFKEVLVDTILQSETEVQFMNPPFRCRLCSNTIVFRLRNQLLVHVLCFHLQVNELVCKLCPFKCVDFLSLRAHMAREHFGIYKTTSRNGKFGSWEPRTPQDKIQDLKLKIPRKNDSGIPRDAQNSTESIGKNLLEKNDIFGCPKCVFITHKKYSLLTHIIYKHITRAHGTSPNFGYFPCTLCNVNYWTPGNLAVHGSRAHGPALHCPRCESGFPSVSALRGHISAAHPREPWSEHVAAVREEVQLKVTCLQQNTATGLFDCFLCSEGLGDKPELRHHIEHEHVLSKLIKCRLCSFVCPRKGSVMNDHITNSHSVQIEVAGLPQIQPGKPLDRMRNDVTCLPRHTKSLLCNPSPGTPGKDAERAPNAVNIPSDEHDQGNSASVSASDAQDQDNPASGTAPNFGNPSVATAELEPFSTNIAGFADISHNIISSQLNYLQTDTGGISIRVDSLGCHDHNAEASTGPELIAGPSRLAREAAQSTESGRVQSARDCASGSNLMDSPTATSSAAPLLTDQEYQAEVILAGLATCRAKIPAPLIKTEEEIFAKEEEQVREVVTRIRQCVVDPKLGIQCYLCSKSCRGSRQWGSRQCLMEHVLLKHLRIEQFRCSHCTAKFFLRKSALTHSSEEHPELPVVPGVRRFPPVNWSHKSIICPRPRKRSTGKGRPGRPPGRPRESSTGQGHVHLECQPVVSTRCSPDLLAGSGAQGRRVSSRPYPDSLPPVPGGCLPCSVQL